MCDLTKSYDIVITSCDKDKIVLQYCIESIQKYVKNYRRLIVVSEKPLIDKENIEWFDEAKYPFTKKTMYEEMYNIIPDNLRRRKLSFINQLLKLYAHYIIPNLKENILIIDSDVIFIKETSFFDIKNNNLIPKYGNNYMYPNGWSFYFNHFKKLHPSFNNFNKSGICHHIIYNKYVIEELFNKVEKYHSKIFWKIYLNLMDNRKNEINCEPANCELYYNYVCFNHNDKIIQRQINWLESPAGSGKSNEINNDYEIFNNKKQEALDKNCNYIVFHSYNRDLNLNI